MTVTSAVAIGKSVILNGTQVYAGDFPTFPPVNFTANFTFSKNSRVQFFDYDILVNPIPAGSPLPSKTVLRLKY